MIKKLDWDSDFFGFNVGQIINKRNIYDVNNYSLLVFIKPKNTKLLIDDFENTFQEIKVIFSKEIETNFYVYNDISDTDFEPLKPVDLYNLAYESGKHSRFKLDTNFKENQFKELYKKWIDNSLNKQFADKVFYIKNDSIIAGFVSIKKHENHATIGLIAVDGNQQGQGIGQKLLQKAEQYCIENNIFELRIPTQKENQQACHFYTKNGYKIFEETIIKHYWRK